MWLAEGICKDVVIAIDGFEDELFIDCLSLKKKLTRRLREQV